MCHFLFILGIGFIGGGAIFKGEDSVKCMASATSLWNTGAIGLAVAFDRFEVAIALSLLKFLTLYLMGRYSGMRCDDPPRKR